jgi:hypothetical protein
VCEQVGRAGCTVAEVACELGCDWHTVNDAVMVYGAADTERIGAVDALGLDEILLCRTGRLRTQHWCTSIVEVPAGQLLDVVAGRSARGASAWLEARPTPGYTHRRTIPVCAAESHGQTRLVASIRPREQRFAA